MFNTELEPRSVNVQGFNDPPGTFRATSLSQCVSLIPEIPTLDYLYEVGSVVDNGISSHVVKNRTTNVNLLVEIDHPDFVDVFPAETFTLAPGAEFTVSLRLDSAVAENLLFTKQRAFDDKIIVRVSMDEDINGPIYVST